MGETTNLARRECGVRSPTNLLTALCIVTILAAGCSSQKYSSWALAANGGDAQSAKSYILDNRDLDSADIRGDTPLLWAARNGHLDVVEHLIDDGPVNIDSTNRITGETALMLSIKAGHQAVIEFLIQSRANVEAKDNAGNTARDWAALRGDNQSLVRIASASASNSASNASASIVAAVYSDNLDSVRLLADGSSTLNDRDSHGETPFVAVAKTGNMDIARYLTSRGADFRKSDSLGRSPFILAVQAGHIGIVSFLIDSGIRAETQSFRGFRALAFAVANGQSEMVYMLLRSGADVNSTTEDEYQLTPLILAAQAGHVEVVAILLEQGADIDKQSANGDSALALAAGNGHAGLHDLLLQHGASPNTVNSDGYSPVTLSALGEHWYIADQLIASGVELTSSQVQKIGETPELAAPLHELFGQRYLRHGDKNASIESFEHAHRSYLDVAQRFRKNARSERFKYYLGVAAEALLISGATYAQAEQARLKATEFAEIRALGSASTPDEYFRRRNEYIQIEDRISQEAARAAEIEAQAQSYSGYDSLRWTTQADASSEKRAAIAQIQADRIVEILRCLQDSIGANAEACVARLNE